MTLNQFLAFKPLRNYHQIVSLAQSRPPHFSYLGTACSAHVDSKQKGFETSHTFTATGQSHPLQQFDSRFLLVNPLDTRCATLLDIVLVKNERSLLQLRDDGVDDQSQSPESMQ